MISMAKIEELFTHLYNIILNPIPYGMILSINPEYVRFGLKLRIYNKSRPMLQKNQFRIQKLQNYQFTSRVFLVRSIQAMLFSVICSSTRGYQISRSKSGVRFRSLPYPPSNFFLPVLLSCCATRMTTRNTTGQHGGTCPDDLEWIIFIWIIGFCVSEMQQVPTLHVMIAVSYG